MLSTTPLLEDHWQKSLLMSCDFGQILGCDKEMGRLVWQVIWAAVAASTVQGDNVDAVCRVHDFGSSSASDSGPCASTMTRAMPPQGPERYAIPWLLHPELLHSCDGLTRCSVENWANHLTPRKHRGISVQHTWPRQRTCLALSVRPTSIARRLFQVTLSP